MIIDSYKNKYISVDNVFFSKKAIRSNADIVKYTQSSHAGVGGQDFQSPVISLEKTEDAILSNFRKKLRYDIRKIENSDEVSSRIFYLSDIEEVDKFCAFFLKFSKIKNIPSCNRGKIIRMAKNIVMSWGYYSGSECVCHLYVCDHERMRLLYSGMIVDGKDVSNNYASNINKFLHKKDILWAKSEGFYIYDFGGVSLDNDRLSGINDFKLGFSKTVENTYNYYYGNTVLGKVVLFVCRFFKIV